MFENIKKYNEGFHTHNNEIIGKQVVMYPEYKLSDVVVTSDFGDCSVVCSDLYDLFNQTRIANLGADVVRDFIARNYPVSSSISDRISRMSDDEILSSIKPRNIQSYSELMMWSKYLLSEINNAVEASEASETSEEVNNETSHNSESDT